MTNDRFAQEGVRALDALVDAGLLTSADTTTTTPRFTLGPDGGSGEAVVPAKTYELTDAGRAAYRTYESGVGSVGAFCYGRWESEIVGFTDPAESSEGNLTTVTYTRRLADTPSWAAVPVLASRSTTRRHGAAGPEQLRMYLVRTDTGWVRTGG
ncbi:hypothetical protein [Longimicrobium terrae]|uniref:Uncharacterized protein n=1 Tax=Longimicrobium terrae TaxID=1639882 RepID=A0A841H1D7_9BACT|nr:hypothetical protein [Longimicrobium terrae]MBB4637494.1 hypothetical protein [Longimicrobium terrae]MBB6071891.1 hypothetical protein [Longimicrobium terrae]NNC30441.1 hypothetical protein [Longimicrobium terrae]